MLKSERITLIWNKKNKKYYIEKGYKFTSYGDPFEIKVEDLTNGSHAEVSVLCDYCLENGVETEILKTYYNYVRHRKDTPKDACTQCTPLKKMETNIKKYGVKAPLQNENIKKSAVYKKKPSITQIKNEFELRNMNLISDIYLNSKVKLEYICLNHNDIGVQTITYSKFKQGQGCKYCYFERQSENQKLDYNFIKYQFELRNYTLISTTYEGNQYPLQYICHKHPNEINKITYSCLQQGQGCKLCANEKLSELKRLDENFVFDFFAQCNHTVYDGEVYIDSHTPIKFICTKHPEIVQETTYVSLKNCGNACKICRYDKTRGENSYLWKGGVTQIKDYLRKKIYAWKKDSMINCNFKCVITGDNFDIIHHLYSFNNIVNETFECLNLPIYKEVSLYSETQLNLLEEKVLELHYNYPLGVCLREDIHKLFHHIYGVGNTTPEQFMDFKTRYFNGEFNHLLIKSQEVVSL